MTRDSKTADRKPSLRVRSASLADSGQIARLHYLSHTISFRPFTSAEWVLSRDVLAYENDWRRRLSSPDALSGVWIAIEDEEVVGVAALSPLPDDPAAGNQRTAVIRSVHVHPQRLGRGIGRRLWRAVVSFLRERGYVRARLDTIQANAPARRFFEAAGGRLVRLLPTGVEGVPIAMYEFDLQCPIAAPLEQALKS